MYTTLVVNYFSSTNSYKVATTREYERKLHLTETDFELLRLINVFILELIVPSQTNNNGITMSNLGRNKGMDSIEK